MASTLLTPESEQLLFSFSYQIYHTARRIRLSRYEGLIAGSISITQVKRNLLPFVALLVNLNLEQKNKEHKSSYLEIKKKTISDIKGTCTYRLPGNVVAVRHPVSRSKEKTIFVRTLFFLQPYNI